METIIDRRYAATGGEDGPLGAAQGGEYETPDGRARDFAHGRIVWEHVPGAQPLTYFQLNTALILPRSEYKLSDRKQAIEKLVQFVRARKPDVVGLSEVFKDGERQRIIRQTRQDYPWHVDGPDEPDWEQDGGLLLLSRHPIRYVHKSIYRQSATWDSLANKGVIHARVSLGGPDLEVDVFHTHLQAPYKDDKHRATVNAQLRHLGAFVAAYRSPRRPALLMGDLNTDAHAAENYGVLREALDEPDDLWQTAGGDGEGYTTVGGIGRRIDYFLSWTRRSEQVPTYANMSLVTELDVQTENGEFISDHYGLEVERTTLARVTVQVDRPVARIKASFSGFRCLKTTTGAGPDEVFFRLHCTSPNASRDSDRTRLFKEVSAGDDGWDPDAEPLVLDGDPGEWLKITVRGWEADDWPNADDVLGVSRVVLTRADLLQLLGGGRTVTMPVLRKDGGEYVVFVDIEVE